MTICCSATLPPPTSPRVDLGLEEDRGKRFALWSFLHMFGSAPELDVAFENEEDREAARNFMDLLAASEGEGEA